MKLHRKAKTLGSEESKREKVYVSRFNSSWERSIGKLLDASGLVDRLSDYQTVLIKPNLVEIKQPPITTPVDLVEALVDCLCERVPGIRLIVGEGNGATGYNTWQTFEALGYSSLASRKCLELMDLNEEPLVQLSRAGCRRWPVMHLPLVLFESFLISVPVLKAHSLAGVTLTMKNMMGAAPPHHYQQGGHWKKASFHNGIQEAVFDLNRYRTPDFTILDATIGMQEAHLWGPTCEPPPDQLAASFDPVAVDSYGAGLLGRDWRQVGHLRQAHGVLGIADPLQVVEVG